DWGQDFAANAATGRLPSVSMLAASRLAATLFFCGSILAIYGLGRLFGSRRLALIISGLYALNPILLMHGRRAMLEAPLLCCALVTLWVAGVISTRKPGERLSGWWWLALAFAGGFGMAAKYTYGFIFAAALGWIVLSRVLEWIEARHFRDGRTLAKLALRIALVGVAALAIFIGLTPALWSNPPLRIRDALDIVQSILASQVRNNQAIVLSLPQRFQYAASIPYLTHIEAGHTAQETIRYGASLLHGVDSPGLIGVLLTGLAAFGLITALVTPLAFSPRRQVSALRIGLLMWLAVSAVIAVQTPLPWQRYFVMFVPLATLLTGIGLQSAAHIILWVTCNRFIPLRQAPQPE
ncbi:MAG: glycosyltransferase family 39 protein, partial [Chloroflexota bacterium]